jgi:hypothetical protein
MVTPQLLVRRKCVRGGSADCRSQHHWIRCIRLCFAVVRGCRTRGSSACVKLRLIASVDAGRPVVLTREQVRHANTYEGLDLITLCATWKSGMAQEQLMELNYLIPTGFVQTYDGYRLSRIICETVGVETDMVAATQVARRVGAFDDRTLWVITREAVLALVGSVLTHLFQPHERILHLREGDQGLLLAALSGATDEELSQQLKLSIGALKKRWEMIFDRASTVLPQLFPMTGSAEERIRGKQKRHHILAYVREHPEELRPYDSAAKENLTASQ